MCALRTWRCFSIVMVLILNAGILSLIPMPAMADATVVTFPDANLEAAIRVAIGKPSGYIYASDLASLTDIDLSTKGIINLSGLEYCTGLTRLSLSNNRISNLTPLAGLTNLEDLNLEDNRISNLTTLAGLTKLTILNLPRNQISNLSPLAGLVNLLALNLGDNRISNVTPLAGLTKLTILNLQNNRISNHTSLAGLANLLALNLQNNQISHPTLLGGLTKLTILNLQNNRISNLTPLAGLADLLALNLANNQISNLAPLAGLTKLTIINLQDNRISNLAPLVANSGLGVDDAVDLRANPLSKTSVDVYIPALEARQVKVLWDTAAPDVIPVPDNFYPTGLATPSSEVSNMISTRPHSASMPSTMAHPPPIQLPDVSMQQAAISSTEANPDSPVSDNSTILYISVACLFLAFVLGMVMIYRRFTV